MRGGTWGQQPEEKRVSGEFLEETMSVQLTNLLPAEGNGKPCAALFLSGTGSNAEKLLARFRAAADPACRISVIVTDAPDRSSAARLAREYDKPLVALDIREFYRRGGLTSISLATERGRELREEWTEALRRLLQPYRIDFGILAGFVPLTNLTGDFPCLNVHPADLTIRDEAGGRLLAGLHRIPVERALAEGYWRLRSSVILARPYTRDGKGEMDSGFILGVSPAVAAETENFSREDFSAMRAARQAGTLRERPDDLARLAEANLERLKICGDHVVFPQAVEAFARGQYATDGQQLYFRLADGEQFRTVETVEFGAGAPVLIGAGEGL